MRAERVSQHVTPMVVVLDEIALRKAGAKALSETRHIDDWNAEQSSGGLNAFNAHAGEGSFVQRAGVEGVRLIDLNCVLAESIDGRKGFTGIS